MSVAVVTAAQDGEGLWECQGLGGGAPGQGGGQAQGVRAKQIRGPHREGRAMPDWSRGGRSVK